MKVQLHLSDHILGVNKPPHSEKEFRRTKSFDLIIYLNYQTTSVRLIVSSGWFCVWVTHTPSRSEVVVLVGMKKTNNTAEPTHTEAKQQYTLALWPSIACIYREHENTMETMGKREVVKKLIYRWAAGTHKPRCICVCAWCFACTKLHQIYSSNKA